MAWEVGCVSCFHRAYIQAVYMEMDEKEIRLILAWRDAHSGGNVRNRKCQDLEGAGCNLFDKIDVRVIGT